MTLSRHSTTNGTHVAVFDTVFTALLFGFGIGFVGSIPIAGPTAVVVVDSTLANRPRSALDVAIGAAVAESMYAAGAFWGLTALFTGYPVLVPATRVFGAVVLVLVGIYFLQRRIRPHTWRSHQLENHHGRRLLFGFTITLFNPTLAATWAAAVAAVHSVFTVTYSRFDALPFALGAGLGIIGWFWLLVRLLCRFRERVQPTMLNHLIRMTGGALVVVGVALAARAAIPMH